MNYATQLIIFIFVIIPGTIIYFIIDSKKEEEAKREKREKARKEREMEDLIRIYKVYQGELNIQSSAIMKSESKELEERGIFADQLRKKAIDVQEQEQKQKKKEVEEIEKNFNFEKRLSMWAEECLYSEERVMLCLKNAASKGKMEYCIRHEFPQKETEKYGLDVYQFLTKTYSTFWGKKKLGDYWQLDEEKTNLLKGIVNEYYKKCLNDTGVQISEILIEVRWEDENYVGRIWPQKIICDIKLKW